MTKTYMNVGVIGCGMISDWYFKAAKRFQQMKIVACGDLKEELAKKQGETYGIPVKKPDDIYTDPEIELILNLVCDDFIVIDDVIMIHFSIPPNYSFLRIA